METVFSLMHAGAQSYKSTKNLMIGNYYCRIFADGASAGTHTGDRTHRENRDAGKQSRRIHGFKAAL